MALLVNLFGGPCTRKTTTAIRIAGELMRFGKNTEYVPEYAKGLTYEGRSTILGTNQLYILAKQEKHVAQAYAVQDFVVTDSPFLMGLAYFNKRNNRCEYTNFRRIAKDLFSSYNTLNFYLNRGDCFDYNPVGRIKDEGAAKLIDKEIKRILLECNVIYTDVESEYAYETILCTIMESVEFK